MKKAWRASRRAWLLATLAGLSIPCAQAAAPDAILGTWLTDDGASKVEVTAVKAPDGSSFYGGKISWLKEPTRDGKPLRDANNADSALRERSILGLPILAGSRPTAAGRAARCTRRATARATQPNCRSLPTDDCS